MNINKINILNFVYINFNFLKIFLYNRYVYYIIISNYFYLFNYVNLILL